MKYGEIKLEALKLMFVNNGEDIVIQNLKKYARDDTYKSYLINMPGAINRCFSRIEEKGVLPLKSIQLDNNNWHVSGITIRFDVLEIKDYFDIDRVVCENLSGCYDGNYDYEFEGSTLVMEHSVGNNYRVVYRPKIARVNENTSDDCIVDVPDNIASHIPYFIKGDLYRDDEPNEAGEARNWFESTMAELSKQNTSKQSRVKNIYSQLE